MRRKKGLEMFRDVGGERELEKEKGKRQQRGEIEGRSTGLKQKEWDSAAK